MLVIWYHIFLFSCMHSCIVHLHDCSTDYWLAESSTSWSDINICSSRSLSLPPVYYRVKAAPLNENSSVEMLWLWNPCYSSRRNLEKRSDLCRYAPRIPPPWLLLVLNLQRDKEHIGEKSPHLQKLHDKYMGGLSYCSGQIMGNPLMLV